MWRPDLLLASPLWVTSWQALRAATRRFQLRTRRVIYRSSGHRRPAVGVKPPAFRHDHRDNFASQATSEGVPREASLRHCSGTMGSRGSTLCSIGLDAIDASVNTARSPTSSSGLLPASRCPVATLSRIRPFASAPGFSAAAASWRHTTLPRRWRAPSGVTPARARRRLTTVESSRASRSSPMARRTSADTFAPGGQQDAGPASAIPLLRRIAPIPGSTSRILRRHAGIYALHIRAAAGRSRLRVSPSLFPADVRSRSEVAARPCSFASPALRAGLEHGPLTEEVHVVVHQLDLGGSVGKLGVACTHGKESASGRGVLFVGAARVRQLKGASSASTRSPVGGLLFAPARSPGTSDDPASMSVLGPTQDGTWTSFLTLPVAPALACGAPLHFQAFYVVSSSPLTLEGSQVRTMWLH